jgi:hypothetical protein
VFNAKVSSFSAISWHGLIRGVVFGGRCPYKRGTTVQAIKSSVDGVNNFLLVIFLCKEDVLKLPAISRTLDLNIYLLGIQNV